MIYPPLPPHQVAPSNDYNYGRRVPTRVVNYVVRGRCRTFNLWPGMLQPATELWLVVKKEKRSNESALVWQIIAYANQERPRPELEDLCWKEDGVVKVGAAVYVGRSGDNSGDVALTTHKELIQQDLFKAGMPPTTEVFFRI